MASDKDRDAKTDLQRRFLIGSSLAFAGTAASGVLTGCGGGKATSSTAITPTAEMPTFAPGGGAYASAQNVTISTGTSGATIHWTTDGSTPTVSSAVYSGAIPVNTTTTVRAIAAATGYQPSGVASAAYSISESQVATPTFVPGAGTYSSAQTVTISSTTSGVTIYYTTDGSNPTTSSSQYSSPVTVSSTQTLSAIALAPGDAQSAVGSAKYTINVSLPAAATPTFSPAAGSYSAAQTVTISSATAGASIYYTTDGSTPTTGSSAYAAPITVTASATVQAIAVAEGYQQSAVGSATYTINIATPIAATPTFTPATGSYTKAQTVAIACATSGATIHYTTNGSTPTSASPAYSAPISVSATGTIKAVAIATGYQQSAVASATYTINIAMPTAATPTFTPSTGSFTKAQTVAMACATSGAAIHYTTNGTTPTTASSVYSAPISIGTTATVKAIATATGYQESAVGSATITISTVSKLTITTASSLPNATEGNAYSETLTATGGTAPYTWSLVSDSGSSNTWKVSSAGVISGTPTLVETDTLSIQVTDSAGNLAGPQSFSLAVQSSSGLASAPNNFQLINQGGPNASQQGFYNVPSGFGGSGGSNSGSATGLGISADYQGFTWLAATAGAYPVSSYNIYRNGSLYDSVSSPITITGYIAPGTDSLGQSVGILTVTAVSGGSSKNGISDGKILCGLKLASSAGGFVSGTKVVAYSSAAYGGGGTGKYYVDHSQTVGSSSSPQTFQGWSYNDTASTNSIPFNFSGVATIYTYTVTAVDTQGSEGPHAYPTAYMYQGISMTGQANFSFGGTTTWNDTSGSPVNGPYDVMIAEGGGGFGFQPVWCGANGDNNNHTYMCPTQHFENGAFNFVVFDIKPADGTYNGGVGPVIVPIMRTFGCHGGVDTIAEQGLNIAPYCTPPLAAGQWSHCKIPFSALTYGKASVQATFTGVGQYQGKLSVTSINSMEFKYVAGCVYVTGPGIPANSYTCGSPDGGASGWTDPQPPYSYPAVFNIYGPNIVGTENTGAITVSMQGSSCYKQGWIPNTSLGAGQGTIYLNNIGFSTV
jgi:hypothetical protein